MFSPRELKPRHSSSSQSPPIYPESTRVVSAQPRPPVPDDGCQLSVLDSSACLPGADLAIPGAAALCEGKIHEVCSPQAGKLGGPCARA